LLVLPNETEHTLSDLEQALRAAGEIDVVVCGREPSDVIDSGEYSAVVTRAGESSETASDVLADTLANHPNTARVLIAPHLDDATARAAAAPGGPWLLPECHARTLLAPLVQRIVELRTRDTTSPTISDSWVQEILALEQHRVAETPREDRGDFQRRLACHIVDPGSENFFQIFSWHFATIHLFIPSVQTTNCI